MAETKQELERRIFAGVVERTTPAEQAAFLDGACGHDPALRARMDLLLEGHFAGEGFLTEAPVRDGRSAPEADEAPPQTVGPYRLLEKIGEGGFGEVWMAEQRQPVKRRVAVKILKLGMDTKQVVARFEAERQALAMMDHPNIAKIFDGGATENGRLYFVMELVKGLKITEYCDKHALPTKERLGLFVLVCQAIQHAHQKGIIHRDIKPSNILVSVEDGVPSPKVIDFGIAKATQGQLTDKTAFTLFQQFIGTPTYISPEQAEMSRLDIDTRSDIYSLGVLLYELMVGQPPFDDEELLKGGIDALRRIIREKEPTKPSTKLRSLPPEKLTNTAELRQTDPLKLAHSLKGDLDWIVMKCLEKDRARRYETANGLAADIRRYLANEPVVARPPSTAYWLRKLVRRNRLRFAAAAAVTLALVAGAGGVILVQKRANQEFRRRLYISEIGRAGAAWQAGQAAETKALLESCPPQLRNWEWDFLNEQLDHWVASEFANASAPCWTAISADAKTVAVAAENEIRILEFPSGNPMSKIPFEAGWQSPFLLSRGGDQLATLEGKNGTLKVWSARTGQIAWEMGHGGPAQALDWSPDGQRLASGGIDGAICLWDATTGAEKERFVVPEKVLSLAFSPDGKSLAAGTTGKTVRLLDSSNGIERRNFLIEGEKVSRLKFSPDGRKLAIANTTFGGFRPDNRVWNLEDGGSLDLSTSSEVLGFSFSPDSRQVFLADSMGMVRRWDLERRIESERFKAHLGSGIDAHLLPGGQILSSGADGTVKLWQSRHSGFQQLKGYPDSLRTLAFSPDGRWLAAAGLDSNVLVWDAKSAQLAASYTNHSRGALAVAFNRDGQVATTGHDREVRVWNPNSLETFWTRSLAPATDAYWLAWSPDGKRLFAASRTETVTVMDANTGESLKTIGGLGKVVDGLAVSPDGAMLAICSKVNLSVWLADGSRELWRAEANPVRCAAFSPDGKWIATGDQDGAVSLWPVASEGRVRRRLTGHSGSVHGVGFSPDGTRLVSSGADGQVKVWDWRGEAEVLSLHVPGGGILWHALFSPDGKTIAAAGGDGVVTLWRKK